MKEWQRAHLQQKRTEQIQSHNYDNLIKNYADYFYKSNIELYAVERALYKSQFKLHSIKDLYNIMASDDIFKDDLYKPTFKTKGLKIPGDTQISELVRKNLNDSIQYSMYPYFLSKKNPGHKFFYEDIDKAIANCNTNLKHSYKKTIYGIIILLICIGVYIWN